MTGQSATTISEEQLAMLIDEAKLLYDMAPHKVFEFARSVAPLLTELQGHRVAVGVTEDMVRPLEWHPFQGGYWLRAQGAGRVYEILASAPDRQEKQAAAQADYATCILAAINPQPGR